MSADAGAMAAVAAPTRLDALARAIEAACPKLHRLANHCSELTYAVSAQDLRATALVLRDSAELKFEMCMDVCGVDYLEYGRAEWNTEHATATGFSRAVKHGQDIDAAVAAGTRFAVVYHLLSIALNHRVRLRVLCADDAQPMVDSMAGVWAGTDWFERETFDMFGILFRGHPDLRRLLTDYGFIGHPFRKDFPLSGNVEVRYDPQKGRVVYQAVSIEPRVLVPKVIRHDNRYDPALTNAHVAGATPLSDGKTNGGGAVTSG